MINVQAHRGASGYAPENTLASFRLAVAMRADGIECDIHLTSDDVFVVCHDSTIDRTSNGTGVIRETAFEELRKYDFGAKFQSRFAGEKIPTLEEMLDIVAPMKVVNIEIKKFGGDDDTALNRFYDILVKYDILSNTIVSSFDREILKRLHEMHEDVYTCLLYGEPDGDMPEIALSLGCKAIHPWIDALTREVVEEAHAKGLKVNCWTPNTPEMLDKATSIGCDGIISNYPDRAFEAIDRA